MKFASALKHSSRFWGALVLGLCLSMPTLASEVSLRLAFVYNFIKFIEWPNNSDQIQLCIVGDQPELADLLLSLKDKKITGRNLLINHIPKMKSSTSFESCQLVYLIASSDLSSVQSLLPASAVLAVNEAPEAHARVSFSLVKSHDNRIEFFVNTSALLKANATVSSQLLKLAKNYQGEK